MGRAKQGYSCRKAESCDDNVDEKNQDDIREAQDGDQDAYRRLLEQHEAEISRLMWRFCQNAQVCEELVQEVFVEAYCSLGSYKFKAPFIFWLKRIATRVGYRFWKQRDRQRRFVRLDETPDVVAPPRETDKTDIQQLAYQLLERLPSSDRLVLTLLYFDKCSTEQIADRMGWSRAMVKMRAYRARAKLRTIVENEHLLEDLEWTP